MASTVLTRTGSLLAPPGVKPEADPGFRPDIQGLRAIAVGLVVVYHLVPTALPGGYVGVDVFFVISGYLITGHLAKTLARKGTVSLLDFYGRRARRLMPAAALVLTLTWVAALLVLPTTRLAATAGQVRASALYVQNWVLAHDAVTYLTSEDAASPVQHFWSLSVEEQFYLGWPLLFLLAGALAARWVARPGVLGRRSGAQLMLVMAVVVLLGSLGFSAYLTATNPAAAYFVTPTRIWELAFGGVLALLPARLLRTPARVGLLGFVGLVVVVGSAFVLTGSAAFPGTVALYPVVGTVLLLLSGSPRARLSPAVITTTRPMVFLGDISYSLYLWHWPVIVLYKTWSDGPVGWLDGPVLVIVSVGLAWLTKRYVEDTVRLSAFVQRSARHSLATLLVIVVPVALTTAWTVQRPEVVVATADARHPGAAVLSGEATAPSGVAAIPSLDRAAHDYGGYGDGPGGCQTDQAGAQETLCYWGETEAPTKTVALVGDSVAGTWFDNINALAKEKHWRLVTDLHSLCPWTATMANTPYTAGTPYESCHTWGRQVLRTMIDTVKPDLVITSARPVVGTLAHREAGPEAFAELGAGMATYWRELADHGIGVVAIRESPELGINIPDCLSKPGATPADCSVPASEAIVANSPLVVGQRLAGGDATLVDLNPSICGPKTCEPIVGNVVVYIDQHHVTTTYTATIKPYLDRALLARPELAG